MPAAKKTAPINNRNKKNQSFLSKLIPTTRKAKMITLVAAFAVIGGGFMVYRSFAATSSIIGTFNCAGIQSPSSCAYIPDGTAGYNNKTPSLVHEYKNVVKVWVSNLNLSNSFGTYRIPENKTARYCFKARPMTNAIVGASIGSASGSWSLAPSSTYTTYCTSWSKNAKTQDGYAAINITISPSSTVRVTGLYVETEDAAVTPTTSSPTEGKSPQPAPAPTPAPTPAPNPQPSK